MNTEQKFFICYYSIKNILILHYSVYIIYFEIILVVIIPLSSNIAEY